MTSEVLQTLYVLVDEVRAIRERLDLVIADMEEVAPSEEDLLAEQVAEFLRVAQLHADANGLTLEEASEQLANLLTNLVEHPLETELYFLKLRAAYREGTG